MIETEFLNSIQVLEKVSRKPNIVDCSDAQMQCNKAKNRFEEVIPCKLFVQYNYLFTTGM